MPHPFQNLDLLRTSIPKDAQVQFIPGFSTESLNSSYAAAGLLTRFRDERLPGCPVAN